MKPKTQTQTQRILARLEKGKSITPMEALEKYGCFRLSARIDDLRNEGHHVITNYVTKNGKRFASYELL